MLHHRWGGSKLGYEEFNGCCMESTFKPCATENKRWELLIKRSTLADTLRAVRRRTSMQEAAGSTKSYKAKNTADLTSAVFFGPSDRI